MHSSNTLHVVWVKSWAIQYGKHWKLEGCKSETECEEYPLDVCVCVSVHTTL